ncbi:Mini-ribonuclease 3 [Paenactinomyces guangxiensis]|uniref:Mini-ribonuclease 3 n=2 Tax=Paenactinomyces guangxiensis TaxID=1490290 RepID=A0A7W1WTT5_9BACL|nr:Mini-ribonuclease 3 [Paenactinomyces guangxiensis]MBH8592995.1 Mini-ribonuclease 3 [Paenactinomyces guangxiensis]
MTQSVISKSPRELNPLLLAYLGDAVYEIYVRYHLIAAGLFRPQDLQREATRYVSAGAQAKVCRRIESELTDEEMGILKWGRNAKSGSVPKNARVSDYRYSTGLEALIGYLYVSGNEQRLQELMQLILEQVEKGKAQHE